MRRLSRSIILLAVVVSVGATIPKAKLFEWNLSLFGAANSDQAGDYDFGENLDILSPPGHKAGYFEIEDTGGGRMFYMYFPNRYNDNNAPFVFWTSGGPGLSSLVALFKENGPYEIQDDLTLVWRKHGWDVGHNIVFVDQPLGVGFSKSTESYRVTTEEQVGENIVSFFNLFLDEHPELAEKDLYIAGESYAGHYLPVIARSILNANDKGEGKNLKLKAVIMGNPWTSPVSQFRSDVDFGVENNLITDEKRSEIINSDWDECRFQLLQCDAVVNVVERHICKTAARTCNDRIFGPVRDSTSSLNYYDIRDRNCTVRDCYEFKLLVDFLKLDAVKESMGVEQNDAWLWINRTVYSDLYWDTSRDIAPVVKKLLNDGMNVLIYVGDQDLVCNYIGQKKWIDNMQWDGALDWTLAKEKEWKLSDGTLAGTVRQSGLLTFMVIYGAGHLAPMDQPKVALEMLTTYTRGESFASRGKTPPGLRFLST